MLLQFYEIKKLDCRLSFLCEKEKDLNETMSLKKAKYHGSCKSNYNARSYTRKYDEAQSQVSWLMQVQL